MALTQVQGGMILPSTTLTTPIVATTMGVGGATPSTSGSGITFPATQSASTDANTLDDYEEGTFTPVLDAGISAPTVTYSNRYGFYTKIGRMVYISLRIQVNTISGGSGVVRVAGLPFTSSNSSNVQQNLGGVFTIGVNWGTSATQISPWVAPGETYLSYRGLLNNASNVDTDISGVSGGDYLDAQGWYFV